MGGHLPLSNKPSCLAACRAVLFGVLASILGVGVLAACSSNNASKEAGRHQSSSRWLTSIIMITALLRRHQPGTARRRPAQRAGRQKTTAGIAGGGLPLLLLGVLG